MPPVSGPNGLKAGSMQSASKPFSISMGNRPSTVNSRKRPHSTLDDGSDDDDGKSSGPQLLSGFDRATGRAIAENEPPEKKPLVIAEQKNRDWRTEAGRRKGKNLLPEEEQARRAGREIKQQGQPGQEEEEQKPRYGLLVAQRSPQDGSAARSSDEMDTSVSKPSIPKTADEQALEALLGDGTKGSSRIIANASSGEDAGTWGGDANDFKSDVDTRPDVPSLSDYAAVPIEEFGRALMRGMGWKDGEELGKSRSGASKPREVKMRPALLGIGAKEVPEGLEEMGAWGKGAKKSRRIDRSYMPLVMQNDKTGEKLTEDELAKRRQNETLVQSDKDEKTDRKAITQSEYGSGHRHRERDDDRHRDRKDRNGYSSKHDDRDRSSSHRHRDHDRERSDRDRSDRARGDRRDGGESEKRGDREKPSRDHDDDRRRRKHDDRDRRDRDRSRERTKRR